MDKDVLNMARALGFLEGKIDDTISELLKETCPTAKRLADDLCAAWTHADLIRNGND